jgi:hypothetical protein
MHFLRFLADRRAWKRAQRLHVFEHAADQPLTLPCDAVGHFAEADDYLDIFDQDRRRKFCLAAGRKW